MTEYIYIASESPLVTGSINYQGLLHNQNFTSNDYSDSFIIDHSNNNKNIFPKQLFSLEKNVNLDLKENKEYFFFINNFDEEDNAYFSFSKYFLNFNYQVCSRFIFSNINEKNHSEANVPLFEYIKNHFKSTNSSQILILFALNSYENEPLSEKIELSLNKLSTKELYYKEMKLLKIYK